MQDKSLSKEDMKKKVLELGKHDFMELQICYKKILGPGWYIQNKSKDSSCKLIPGLQIGDTRV